MIKIIAACSKNGVAGKDGKLPWNYSEDLAHFKKMTLNSTIIMGRKTYESIGKPLPHRKNVVITSTPIDQEDIFMYTSLSEAIESETRSIRGIFCTDQIQPKDIKYDNIWLIGGNRIWQEGLKIAGEIHLTITPDFVEGENLTYFPWINPDDYQHYFHEKFSRSTGLKYAVYKKIY